MADGSTQTVDVTTGMVSGFNSSAVVASQTLTVTYDGKITTYTISVNKAAYAGTQAGAPTLASKTENSITLVAQTIGGETVEYAKASSSAVPDSGWQTDTNFIGLSSGTYYYFFARVKETTSHAAGAAASAQIRTNQGEFPDTLNIGSGGITVNNGTHSGIQVIYGSSTYDDLPAATQIVVTGTSGTYTITVNTSCNITLSGVTITPAANSTANAMAAVQTGTVRVLPESGFTSAGKVFAGWQYNGKTYQPGECFTQPSSNVTLKALWNDKVYSIGGIVQEGDPVSNADHDLL